MRFVHIPRTGGKRLVLLWGLQWPEVRFHGPRSVDDDLRAIDGIRSYTIIRDHRERMVSLYERARLLHDTPIPREGEPRPPEFVRRFRRPFPDFDEWVRPTSTVRVNTVAVPIQEWCYAGLFASHFAVPASAWAEGCDYVARFETWEEDLGELGRRLGRPSPTITKSDRRMADYYDSATEALVDARFAADVAAYGYGR